VVKPPRERPSASAGPVPFLYQPRSDAPARSCCRSCRRCGPARPSPLASPAWRRTRRSLPSAGSDGTRCSTCHTRPAAGATASPSAPPTSCPRRRADCRLPVGSLAPARVAAAARSTPMPHPTSRSALPTPPPNDSVESTKRHPVNLCPRGLGDPQCDIAAIGDSKPRSTAPGEIDGRCF